MAELSQEEKKEIIKRFSEKGVKIICPMCNHNQFVIADGYFNNSLQLKLGVFSLGGPSIPSIPIVCSNCGFISQHALGVLNLLPEEEKKKEDEKK